MDLDARAEWINEHEETLEEHATFVENEMVGSGIIVEESHQKTMTLTSVWKEKVVNLVRCKSRLHGMITTT